MIKHIIIWKLDERLSDTEKAERSAEIKQKLEALAGVVPGLLEIKVTTQLLDSSNGDILLDSSFESREALAAYQIHPAHLKAAEAVKRSAVSRSCADYEV